MEKQIYSKPKRVLTIVIVILVLLASAATIINAARLQAVIQGTTKAYVNDVAYQMAQEIDTRLKNAMNELTSLADSLSKRESFDTQMAFLNSKKDFVVFTSLGLADMSGNVRFCDGSVKNIAEFSAFTQAAEGSHGISYLDGQNILYTQPYKQDGTITGVIVGIIDKNKMQTLIESNGFGGNGVSCIIDLDCNVIISPKDLKFFFALEDVFQKNKDQELIENIAQMEEAIKNRQDGQLFFTTVDGNKVLMSYNALKSYEWALLTIVPSDFISSGTDRYLLSTFLIAFLTIFTFIIIIAATVLNVKRYQREIEKVAYVDPVTGDMNIYRFRQRAEQLIQSAPPSSYYMVSLNMKSFKLINAKFGHDEGDRTLRHMSNVIKRNLNFGELAARSEADNFNLCLRTDSQQDLQERLNRIRQQVNSFNKNTSIPYHLNISLGAYLISDTKLNISTMIDFANIARKNKPEEKGDVCFFYDETLIQKLQMEQDLANIMEASLKNGDFKVYFQPKVRLSDGKIGGVEALIRWEHPDRGMIFPSDFIPVFEKNGTICKLDLFVFEQVCRFIHRRFVNGDSVFPVSVNLSRQHFKNVNFLSEFETIKNKYQIPDGFIELEMTESIIFDGGEISYVKNMVDQVHKAGFHCSLDDFGFGYSSLSLLSEFDVDTVKLDRRFFVDETAKRAKWVVEAIVNLTKKLHIQTVAEGIESASQLDALRQMGCDMVQGYVYSKPLPIQEFEQWIRDNEGC